MLRFGIIGFGHIGARHAEHIMRNEHTELVAVCDTDTSVKAKLPAGVLFYDSLESLPADSIDVLCICTPNYLHEPNTLQALSSGWHVVVEKPMALSTAECDRMIAKSRETGRLIFAVKQNRYNPPVQAAKQLIDAGGLGRIFMVQVNCFWNRGNDYYAQSNWRGRKTTDGGCLFTQFSHFVDILYYLNGGIADVSGRIENFAHRHNTEFEDSGAFVMKGNNGSIVNFNFTTCSYEQNMEGAITIFAEKGTLKIGGQYLNTIEYQHLSGPAIPPINITAKANDYGLYKGSMSNHDKVIQNVVDVLVNGDQIMTTDLEGREVISIIERMYAAVNVG